MAFVIQNWSVSTQSANVAGPVTHNYITTVDNMLAVSAPNYFSQVASILSVGDSIYATCSNGVVILEVTFINTTTQYPFVVYTAVVLTSGQSVAAVRSGTLTQTNWNNMSANPVNLIGSMGAGISIIVDSVKLNYIAGTTPFAGGGLIVIEYSNPTLGSGFAVASTLSPTGFTSVSTSQVVYLLGQAISTPITSAANTSIFISNQTAAFTGGAGATIQWQINYRTVSGIA